jgi:hypothetical protein
MSDGLEFTISAKDQASKAVSTVQKKINDLGKDLARGFLSFAGPMALVQGAINYVSNAIEEHRKKVAEAVAEYSGIGEKAAEIGVASEEFIRMKNAADVSGTSVEKVGKLFREVTAIIQQATVSGSDQERMLKALGFSAEQIASGLLKPTEVIKVMADTLSSATSNTEKFSVATAMLGSNAAELIPLLTKADNILKGYGEDPGISQEEIDLLEQQKVADKQKENQEKAKLARQRALEEARKNPEVMAEYNKLFPRDITEAKMKEMFGTAEAAAQAGYTRVFNYKDGYRTDDTFRKTNLAQDEEVLAALKVVEERKRQARKSTTDAANAERAAELHNLEMQKLNEQALKLVDEEMAKGVTETAKEDDEALKKRRKDLTELLDAEAKANDDAAKDAAKKAEKANKLTVSSLREIGGAMAGEFQPGSTAPVIDYQKESLTIEQKMLLELEKLNNIFNEQPRPGVDFTKDPNQTIFTA